MQYKWALAENNFTFLDRLKICGFFLNPNNRWTQDVQVRKYEQVVANYVGSKYAVFVSSGSAANQLICQEVKDRLIKNGEWPRRNKVVVSAVTWQTNVSVWVREGFEPIFIDVNLDDFCLDYSSLELVLTFHKDEIACIFPTSVLGYTPKMDNLCKLCEIAKVELKFDNCENFFGSVTSAKFNINCIKTASTSCFLAHNITTGSEGGFIFTNNEEEYQYFLLSRAHGLLRNLKIYQNYFNPINWEEACGYCRMDTLSNPLVDSNFDFQTLSSNYRSTDIQAFMGLLDFKRVDEYKKHRNVIYELYSKLLDNSKYLLPFPRKNVQDCAFCLPIICKENELLIKVKKYLNENQIEYRGFISGNMLRQLPYQKYGNYKDYPNAEFLNDNAIYIGLHMNVTEKMVKKLCKELNSL